MQANELRLVGRALAKGLETVADRLGEEIEAVSPEDVLADLADDEAAEIGQEWIAQAEAELQRRRGIVEADYERRVFGS